MGQSLQDAIRAVASALAHYHATRALSESESRLFESACRALADVVAPYVVSRRGALAAPGPLLRVSSIFPTLYGVSTVITTCLHRTAASARPLLSRNQLLLIEFLHKGYY